MSPVKEISSHRVAVYGYPTDILLKGLDLLDQMTSKGSYNLRYDRLIGVLEGMRNGILRDYVWSQLDHGGIKPRGYELEVQAGFLPEVAEEIGLNRYDPIGILFYHYATTADGKVLATTANLWEHFCNTELKRR